MVIKYTINDIANATLPKPSIPITFAKYGQVINGITYPAICKSDKYEKFAKTL